MAATETEVTLLRGMIVDLGTSINRQFSALAEEVAEVKADVKETKAQATATNGRVTGIETERAAEKAAKAAVAEKAQQLQARTIRREDYRRVQQPTLLISAGMLLVGIGSLAGSFLH